MQTICQVVSTYGSGCILEGMGGGGGGGGGGGVTVEQCKA